MVVFTASVGFNAEAQFFLGLRSSPYGGVTNADYNPAIADSRFLVDINLIGAAANVNNNYIGLSRQTIYHTSDFNDPNFQSDDLKERINGLPEINAQAIFCELLSFFKERAAVVLRGIFEFK